MSAMDRTDAATPQVLSPASRRKDGDVAEEDRDVAGNLPPEEPPAPVKSHHMPCGILGVATRI